MKITKNTGRLVTGYTGVKRTMEATILGLASYVPVTLGAEGALATASVLFASFFTIGAAVLLALSVVEVIDD